MKYFSGFWKDAEIQGDNGVDQYSEKSLFLTESEVLWVTLRMRISGGLWVKM